MHKTKPTILILTLGLLTLAAAGVAFSDDDDEDDDDERHEHGGWVQSRADVAPVTNAVYAEECGACHMAYQPGLLPVLAWTEIMRPPALAEHYGDDASLSDPLIREISGYLTANAADTSQRTRSRAFAIASGDANGALPRISQTAYFVRKHDEIPARMVTGNPEVGGFSQCNKCHRGAADGVYNEHQVRIPGFGVWED